MSLVFAGVCSHGPGMTGRAHMAEPALKNELYSQMAKMRQMLEATKPDALVVVAAEHFANFFMNNMPAYAIGMADFMTLSKTRNGWDRFQSDPGECRPLGAHRAFSDARRRCGHAQEWKFDHGISVPLHFLTPGYDCRLSRSISIAKVRRSPRCIGLIRSGKRYAAPSTNNLSELR